MKMKRIVPLLLACSLLGISAGCYRTVYRGEDLPFGTSFRRPDPTSESIVDHFKDEKWDHFFIFALVPTSEPDLKAIVGRHVSPGCEVRNLKIRHEVTFLNALVWLFVGGIYNPMTTTVSGDVVRVQNP
ncbi:MAG: hypothetical protein J7M08_03790 [Planctomycetes bacterium]|nr:hypothetical protein [Planctomycetota bacterium]